MNQPFGIETELLSIKYTLENLTIQLQNKSTNMFHKVSVSLGFSDGLSWVAVMCVFSYKLFRIYGKAICDILTFANMAISFGVTEH